MSFVLIGSKQKSSKIVSEEEAATKLIDQESKQIKNVDSILEDKYKVDNADLNKPNASGLLELNNSNISPNNLSVNNQIENDINFPLIFFIFIITILICLGGYSIWNIYFNSNSNTKVNSYNNDDD